VSIRVRTTPEDFRVDEEPLYPASGEGGHTFVRIEKRLRTTEAVARDLARAAGVRAKDVGYAGRKDRVAVTTQWFSVPDLEPEAALQLALPEAKVLEASRHPHKLRTGQLRGNRFALCLRGVDESTLGRARDRLADALARGLPNRFGAQRFGREGDNADRARRYCEGSLRVRDRREARFLVSAWQSEVFNAVLAARAAPLDVLEAGDLAMRHDSGGAFVVDDPSREQSRATAFEISPSGPIFGPKMSWPAGEVALRERRVMEEHGLDPDALKLPGVRARGARRVMRMRLSDAEIVSEADAVRFAFSLPAGCFASVVVEEILGPVEDAGGHDPSTARGGMLTAAQETP
jgi:tRNA pseudouridine13 synthase